MHVFWETEMSRIPLRQETADTLFSAKFVSALGSQLILLFEAILYRSASQDGVVAIAHPRIVDALSSLTSEVYANSFPSFPK
jgi:hypothetical protein